MSGAYASTFTRSVNRAPSSRLLKFLLPRQHPRRRVLRAFLLLRHNHVLSISIDRYAMKAYRRNELPPKTNFRYIGSESTRVIYSRCKLHIPNRIFSFSSRRRNLARCFPPVYSRIFSNDDRSGDFAADERQEETRGKIAEIVSV